MDLGKAFTYILDDDQWLAVILIGGLLIWIPIFGQLILIGFMLEAARNVMRGAPRPLPRWDDFGSKLKLGLYGFVIQLVYVLPAVILAILIACLLGATAIVAGESGGAEVAIVLIGLCGMPLLLILTLICQPLAYAALVRYVQTDSLTSALRVGEVIGIVRQNLGPWVVLWLLSIVCSLLASAGSILLVFGALFTTVYAQAALGHIIGQTARGGSAPAPYAPPPSYSGPYNPMQ